MASRTLSHPLVFYQPLNLIFRLFKITTLLIRLPLWVIQAAVPALRPLPNWTFKQALIRPILKHILSITSSIATTDPLPLQPLTEKSRWVTIDPFPDTHYVGPLLHNPSTRPAKIGGTWYPSQPSSNPQRICLHIHGGAFVVGDGRDANTKYLGKTLVRHARFDALFAPQYRLAGYGGRDPFPAALQDALTSYLYLIRTLGIAPENVTLSGDSAGGNLAIALLRYLERFGEQIGVPKPGRVALLSPWVNPGAAVGASYEQTSELAKTDILPDAFIRWGAKAYILQSGLQPGESEWVDALGKPFATATPVFVSWSDREVLAPQCAAWAEEMGKTVTGRFEVNIEKDAPHDTVLLGDVLAWEKSAEEVAGKIGQFVDAN